MLCHCANYLCNLNHLGDGGDIAHPTVVTPAWRRLGLDTSDIANIVQQVVAQSSKSEVLLSLL